MAVNKSLIVLHLRDNLISDLGFKDIVDALGLNKTLEEVWPTFFLFLF